MRSHRYRLVLVLTVLASCLVAAPAHAAGRAELSVVVVANPPTSRQASTAFSVAATVANTSRTAAGATTASFWLSKDTRRGADVKLGTAPTAKIKGRFRVGIRGTVKVPSTAAAGSYFLLVCADQTRRVREGNEANNCRASRTRITIVRPKVTITSPAAGSTTKRDVMLGLNSNVPVRATCSVDGGAPYACVNTTSHVIATADGPHTLTVRATDLAGNVVVATSTWTVDQTGPVVTITAAPPTTTEETSATFAFTSTEGTAFRCTLDHVTVDCGPPYTYTNLAVGRHRFTVSAADAIGNTGSASKTWTIE
jgi:hypothetical protein